MNLSVVSIIQKLFGETGTVPETFGKLKHIYFLDLLYKKLYVIRLRLSTNIV